MPTPRTDRRARTARETPQPDDAAVGSLSTKRSSRGALATVYSEAAPISSGGAVLGLQGTAGNRAVASLLRSQQEARPRRLQPKLMVGSANDPLEREADRVAELVMRTWSSRSASACAEEGGEVPIQRLADPGHDPASAFQADDSVAKRLAARSGSGQVLPAVVRNRMEAGFGTDFSSVRIHRDAEAADLSTGLAARAFTHGTDIYFAAGAYEPGSRSGRHLLAHELTHVVQQGGAPVRRKPDPRPGEIGDAIPDTGRDDGQALLAHELTHTVQHGDTPAVQRVQIGERPFVDAYSTLTKDPAWHEETAAFERSLGTYAYNRPSAMAAARKSIAGLAAAPRVSRAGSRQVVQRDFNAVLAGEAKARARKVFVGAVLAKRERDQLEARITYERSQQPQNDERRERVTELKARKKGAVTRYDHGFQVLSVWHQAATNGTHLEHSDLDIEGLLEKHPLLATLETGAKMKYVEEGKRQFDRASKQAELLLGNRREVAEMGNPKAILDTGIWSWGVNQAFIEGGAQRRAHFVVHTEIGGEAAALLARPRMTGRQFLDAIAATEELPGGLHRNLWHSAERRPTWYALELAGLLDMGYRLVEKTMVPPGRMGVISRETGDAGQTTYLITEGLVKSLV